MISLKRILQEDGMAGETLLRVIRLLLQGMQDHAIEGDPDDLGGFRMNVQRLIASLEGGLKDSELLVQAGSALQSLQDYNGRTTRYLRRPIGEWQAVVTMLISTIAGVADELTASRLREISGGVRSASGSDEVQKIRLQLAECLTELQLGARQQKSAEAPPIATPSPAVPDAIPETAVQETGGLGARAEAETALASAWQSEPPAYVAVMALDRLPTFNMRFGHSVGDEVVRFYAGFLRARFRETDRLFRWSPSALLVLLPRPNRLEIVRDEIARLMEVRCQHTVQTASRTILLPIAARWAVFPPMAAPRLLIHKIEAFAGNVAATG